MSNEKIFQIDPIPAKTMASNMTSAPQDTNDGDDGMAMTAHDGIEVPMSSGITSVFDSTLPNLTSKQQLQDKPNTCDKNDHEDIASDVLFGEDCSNNELDSGDRTVVVASVICAKNSGSSDMKVDLPIPTPRYEDGVHVPGDNNGVDSIGDANDDFSDGASGVNLGLSKTPLSVERSQTLTAGEALPQRLVNTQTSSTVRHVINPPDDIQAKLDILESLTVDHEPTGSPAQQTMDDLVVDGVGDVSIKITALHDEMDNSMNRANLADDNVTTLESNVFEIIRDTTEHSLPKGNASIQNSGRHLAIRSIVTGSPSKLMNAGKPNKVTSHSTRMEEDVGKPRPKKRVKREKITIDKPLHERPLLSKKDSDQATALLSGKGDLADFLPREDCFILGKLWIFTAKQLSAALNSDSLPLGTPFRASYEEIIHELTHRNFQTRAPPIPVTQSANAEGNTATSGESIEVPSATDGTTTLGTTTTAIDDFHSTKVESSLSNAMDKIATWKEALDKYQTSVTKQEFNKCFRFDGALQILFPLSFLNFVRSARIETLWDFLSMKKTEAGAICEVMLIWRRECGLERIPHIGLARHFLSVANRVEAALSAIPSVPRNDRAWMKDPMNTLTGAGRDFLIFDQKIVSAVEFLSMRTKDASKNLECKSAICTDFLVENSHSHSLLSLERSKSDGASERIWQCSHDFCLENKRKRGARS